MQFCFQIHLPIPDTILHSYLFDCAQKRESLSFHCAPKCIFILIKKFTEKEAFDKTNIIMLKELNYKTKLTLVYLNVIQSYLKTIYQM